MRVTLRNVDRTRDVDVELPTGTYQVEVEADGVRVSLWESQVGELVAHVNPVDGGAVSLDVRDLAAHTSQVRLRIAGSKRPPEQGRDQ